MTGATPISGATNANYQIPLTDVNTTGYKYFYVKITGEGKGKVLETVNSNIVTLTVGYENVATATAALKSWLSSESNQRNLLENYYSKNNILTNVFSSTSSIWNYHLLSIPTSKINSLTYVEANATNGLPFNAWKVQVALTSQSSYGTWNGNIFANPVTLPVGTLINFYLPFGFTFNQSTNEGVTTSTSFNLSNNTSSLTWTNSGLGYGGTSNGFYTIDFINPSNNKNIFQTWSRQITFPTFTNSNSNLPEYPIFNI